MEHTKKKLKPGITQIRISKRKQALSTSEHTKNVVAGIQKAAPEPSKLSKVIEKSSNATQSLELDLVKQATNDTTKSSDIDLSTTPVTTESSTQNPPTMIEDSPTLDNAENKLIEKQPNSTFFENLNLKDDYDWTIYIVSAANSNQVSDLTSIYMGNKVIIHLKMKDLNLSPGDLNVIQNLKRMVYLSKKNFFGLNNHEKANLLWNKVNGFFLTENDVELPSIKNVVTFVVKSKLDELNEARYNLFKNAFWPSNLLFPQVSKIQDELLKLRDVIKEHAKRCKLFKNVQFSNETNLLVVPNLKVSNYSEKMLDYLENSASDYQTKRILSDMAMNWNGNKKYQFGYSLKNSYTTMYESKKLLSNYDLIVMYDVSNNGKVLSDYDREEYYVNMLTFWNSFERNVSRISVIIDENLVESALSVDLTNLLVDSFSLSGMQMLLDCDESDEYETINPSISNEKHLSSDFVQKVDLSLDSESKLIDDHSNVDTSECGHEFDSGSNEQNLPKGSVVDLGELIADCIVDEPERDECELTETDVKKDDSQLNSELLVKIDSLVSEVSNLNITLVDKNIELQDKDMLLQEQLSEIVNLRRMLFEKETELEKKDDVIAGHIKTIADMTSDVHATEQKHISEVNSLNAKLSSLSSEIDRYSNVLVKSHESEETLKQLIQDLESKISEYERDMVVKDFLNSDSSNLQPIDPSSSSSNDLLSHAGCRIFEKMRDLVEQFPSLVNEDNQDDDDDIVNMIDMQLDDMKNGLRRLNRVSGQWFTGVGLTVKPSVLEVNGQLQYGDLFTKDSLGFISYSDMAAMKALNAGLNGVIAKVIKIMLKLS